MKKLVIASILAALIQTVCAVEYVTLSNSKRETNVAPGSLVEIVACTAWQAQTESWNLRIELTLENGDVVNVSAFMNLSGSGSGPVNPLINQKFTGLSKARIFNHSASNLTDALTLKITPAAEIDSAGPKTVLVIPEGSTGDFDVVIESSGDMVTWAPMHSQTVSGSGPKNFFRTRIVKR